MGNLIHGEREKAEEEKEKKQSVVEDDAKNMFDEKQFNSMEHSISYPPLSEFSAEELSLRRQSSEFFIIDGVAIHYCLERNYDQNDVMDEDTPWIVLLHGFGGGVFSWKQSMSLILNNLGDS